MIDLLKSRLYIHVHSKCFKVFLIASILWCVGCLLTILGVGPDKEPISSAYGLWGFMEFYLSAIPLTVAYWYGNFISNRFGDNFPFKFDHKLSFSGVIFTMLMNLICVVAMLICGNILFLIPSREVVYYNDPFTMFKLSLVFFAGSFVRCILVIVLIEITKSKIWGAIFGFLCIGGMSFEFVLSLETLILIVARVKSSSFPIASSTVYQTFASLMPGVKDKGNWAVYELHADISVILIKMLIYFAVATILAVVLIRRKDEE